MDDQLDEDDDKDDDDEVMTMVGMTLGKLRIGRIIFSKSYDNSQSVFKVKYQICFLLLLPVAKKRKMCTKYHKIRLMRYI